MLKPEVDLYLKEEVDLFQTENDPIETNALVNAILVISGLEKSVFDTQDFVSGMETNSYDIFNQSALRI